MNRLRTLIITLTGLMVLSSCSNQYSHLLKKNHDNRAIVEKAGPAKGVKNLSNSNSTNESSEISDQRINEISDPDIVKEAGSIALTKNKVENAEELGNNKEFITGEKLSTAEKISAVGTLTNVRQVNKLRKEVKTAMDNPEFKDDVHSLLYIILVVILILLILSLLSDIFGGRIVSLLLLVLLILLILRLLGMI